MKQKRVYISGPMTDPKTGCVSEENLIAFKRAHACLTKEGYYNLICPTNVWACRWPWIYKAMESVFGKEWAYRLVLLYDLWLLLRCDLIYKIPGWRESRGANIESCIAFHFRIWNIPTASRERIDKRLAKAMEKWRNKNVKNEEQKN